MNETHKPRYFCWYEEDFWSDRAVVAMPRQARHFYRALLCAALFCPSRPYLPTDDEELALLADADVADWQTHKAVVLRKFTKVTVDGVELWSHKRLMEQWDLVQKGFAKWSEMGKKSGEVRRAKTAQPDAEPTLNDVPALNHGSTSVEPTLNNIGSGHWTVDSGQRSNQRQQINGSLAHSLVNESNEETLAAKASERASELRSSFSPTSSGTGKPNTDAESLVDLLHRLLSLRPDVTIPDRYGKLWLSDFKAVLSEYDSEAVWDAVLFSQVPRNQKYFVRAKPICDNMESLVEQCQEPDNAKLVALVWNQLQRGKLPLAAKETKAKTVTEAMAAAPAKKAKGFEDEEEIA